MRYCTYNKYIKLKGAQQSGKPLYLIDRKYKNKVKGLKTTRFTRGKLKIRVYLVKEGNINK